MLDVAEHVLSTSRLGVLYPVALYTTSRETSGSVLPSGVHLGCEGSDRAYRLGERHGPPGLL
jgi:hypothetical protein